ncbi:MAG TPA: flagellar hook protein FlgE [Hyphomonadaceae bacterium]|nr:flagellar hook protein FlgE [Hyphomonadaceae bacterium]HPN04582.1 flagellar hook protein FlgE [Hyphomonadaceae bacterium]
MSINSAMLAGASGMRANSSALAAISDNIANVNTVGYKRLRNDFTSLLNSRNSQPTYSAGGVMSHSSPLMSEQGSAVASSVSTHLAVSGNGFFVVRGRSDNAGTTDPYLYTRAGQFTPDANGYLQNTAGYYLQGWPVDATGAVATNPTDLSALQAVRVSGIAGGAEATSTVSLSANLQSSHELSQAVVNGTYDAADSANNMASGQVTPDFQVPVQVYDSQGGLHTLTMSFLKAGPNQWYTEVHMAAGDIDPGGSTLVDGQVATGMVAFTPFGQIDTANSTLPTTITIGMAGANAGPEWDAGLGLAAQTITLDMGGPNSPGGLTNYDSPSILGTSPANGTPFGSLASVDVDDDGFVTAIFTNGLTRRIYQIPLAMFGNVDGLLPENGGVYRLGPNAGALTMRGAGVGGTGEIKARALESSTVDLAEEFSNLIMTQRAYSASSKIITTADEMLDELIRLKR